MTALIGSSVNFSWSFAGDVRTVTWGLKKAGANVLNSNGRLAYLDRYGFVPVSVPDAYAGRVSGMGDIASGQATFTLSSITYNDENSYGCEIDSTGLFPETKFDQVRFVVEGECAKYYSFIHS